MSDLMTADEWFSLGARVPYDLAAKRILKAGEAPHAAEAVQVFERVVRGLDVRMVPGGHLTTLEQPERLARIIEEVGPS